MQYWFQLRMLSLRLRLFSAKLSIQKVFSLRKERWRKKIIIARNKARKSKQKATRTAKDLIIPSLPGVSKLKLPPSPVPHLLHSNECPTDDEKDLVVQVIAHAETTVSNLRWKLTTRIAAAQTNRGWEMVTRHKIGQASRFVKQHEGVISAVRRLPAEIIQEIFMWATLNVRHHTRYKTVSELPWALSQVSQSWRASALSISTLWSSLPTLELKTSRTTTKLQMGYVTELLRRSRQTPLDIYIYSPYYNSQIHPILDILISHAERWKVLTVEARPILISGLGAARGRLLSLKKLTLQTPWYRFFDGPPTRLDTFEVAPQLQSVSVSGPFAGEVKLPFSQLVHYKERHITSNLMEHVLSSPLLRSLTILELSELTDFPAVTLPHLVKLQIKFQLGSIGTSFHKLTLPAIEDIRVVSTVGNMIANLTTMISRSQSPCRLKTLSVRTGFIEPGDLATLLKLTPQLRSLDTTITPSNNFIDVASLAYKGPGGSPLVPLLEKCKFYVEDPVSMETSQALNEFASLRCELETDSEGAAAPHCTHVPDSFRQLKTLCVYSDAIGVIAHRQQSQLEGWCSSPSSNRMSVFKTQLVMEVPDLMHSCPLRLSGYPTPLSKKALERVTAILRGIDAENIIDPEDIYVSGIHFTLQSLSQMRYAANSEESGICKCAKAILEKWHPLFLANISDRHWAFKGPQCLGYVPKNDAIRNSSDALNIIYGFKDDA